MKAILSALPRIGTNGVACASTVLGVSVRDGLVGVSALRVDEGVGTGGVAGMEVEVLRGVGGIELRGGEGGLLIFCSIG
jgi:hypothetical protein